MMKMEYLLQQYREEIRALETRIRDLKTRQREECDREERKKLSARIWTLMPILIENRDAYKQCRRYAGYEEAAFADSN